MKPVFSACFFASLLAGCAATSHTNPTPATVSPIPNECVNPDSDVQAACAYLLGEAQNSQNQVPFAEPVIKALFPSVDPETIKHNSAEGHAGWLIREEIVTDSGVAQTIKQYGLPDAIEFEDSRTFAMYYRKPSRTFILCQGRLITLRDTPRSIRVLLLKEQEPSTPWPVTLTGETRELFEVPQAPLLPPDIDATDYTTDDSYIRSQLATSADRDARNRASAMLQRLAAAAAVAGVNWQVVVFSSSQPNAFAVPDGTLFISDFLINSTSDSELAATIAHLMGHVRWGHYRKDYEANISSKTELMFHPQPLLKEFSARTCITRMVGSELLSPFVGLYLDAHANIGAPLFTFIAPVAAPLFIISYRKRLCDPNLSFSEAWRDGPSMLGSYVSPAVDSRKKEWHANYIAAQYLVQAGIRPEVLFDAMAKLSSLRRRSSSRRAKKPDWITQ